MDAQIKEMARAALASGINRPMLAYYEARLEEVKVALLSCDEKMFRMYQGRGQELQESIALIKSAK